MLTRSHPSHPAAHCHAAAAVQRTPSVRAHFDCLLGSLTTLFCLCSVLMQYVTPDRLTLGLGCMVGKTAVMAVSDAWVEGYKH